MQQHSDEGPAAWRSCRWCSVAQGRRGGSGLIAGLLTAEGAFGGHSLAPGVRYWGASPQVNQSRRRPGIVRRRSSSPSSSSPSRWQQHAEHWNCQTDTTDSQVSLTLPSSFPSSLSSTLTHPPPPPPLSSSHTHSILSVSVQSISTSCTPPQPCPSPREILPR